MPFEEAGPGIFRLGNRTVNWWAVVKPEGITLIDAGLPRHLMQLEALLDRLGRPTSDVRALVLTHADLDHIGFAERLRREGIEVFIHPSDASSAAGEFRPLPKQALLNAWRPRMLVGAFEYARDGVLGSRPVSNTKPLADGVRLAIPGKPLVLHVPGHSPGSCALLFEDYGALFTGDALVTLDPLSGKRGPGLLPDYDNLDQQQALESLQRLLETDADLVLPGHGAEWNRTTERP